VWMGTTMGCVQCHNHKFDPFQQKEYYQLLAFFNGTADQGRSNAPMLPVFSVEQIAQRKKLAARIAPLQKQLDTATPKLAAARAGCEESPAGRTTAWSILEPARLTSARGTTLSRQADGSILAGGQSPETDTYTIVVNTKMTGITGVRLEVLPDKSLPGSGPGRANGNFVLNELRVTAGGKNTPAQPVPLQNAAADFAQQGFPVAAVIDGNPKSGWAVAPQFGRAHEAVFETKQNINIQGGTTLTLTLDQNFGSKHTLGRFRLSATT